MHFAINQFNIIGCLFYTRFYLGTANQQAEHRSDNKKKRDFSFGDITDVLNELSKDKGKVRKSETISQPGNKELPSDSDNCSSSNKARISKPADETEVLNRELASSSTEPRNKSSLKTNTTRDGDMEVLNLKVPSPSSNCLLVVSTQRRKSSRRSNRRRSSFQRSHRRRSSS